MKSYNLKALCELYFWKNERACAFDKTICRETDFPWLQLLCSRSNKEAAGVLFVSSGLPVSLCVAKHYQQRSQIFHKLRKIGWGSSERNFFFSKPLTACTTYICSRDWFIISKNNTFFFKLLYLWVWLLYPDLYVSEKMVPLL